MIYLSVSYQSARLNLLTAIRAVTRAVKTEGYYARVLDRAVRDLYAGEMNEGEFIDEQIRLIEEQFRRAWNEGMRNVGLDPEKDLTDEWEMVLLEQIDKEQEFILDYADAIIEAREAAAPIDPLRGRVDLWVNRYPEMTHLAEITCGGESRLLWRLGATEEHCNTCYTLDGTVATAEEWEASGYHPQGAPNDKLECGGWRCDCSLEPTDEPATEGGIPNA